MNKITNETKIFEINAWANVLDAVGQDGHNKVHTNQHVLNEITSIVKENLESLSKLKNDSLID